MNNTEKTQVHKDAKTGVVELYLHHLAPGSRRTILSALERIAAILSNGQQNATTYDWGNVTENDIAQLQQLLVSTYNYKPTTVNKMISALHGVLREIRSDNRKQQNELEGSTHIKPLTTSSTTQLGRVIGDIAIKALLGACTHDNTPIGTRDAALIVVFLCAGLRRSEAVSLSLHDYDQQQRVLRVIKNGTDIDRVVPLGFNACRTIDRWISVRGESQGFLFLPLNRSHGFDNSPMDVHTSANIVRKRASQAGVVEISPIDLRYTYINILYSKGLDFQRIQYLSGLSSQEAVSKYINPSPNERIDTVDIPYYE